jgi:hypothetical protein
MYGNVDLANTPQIDLSALRIPGNFTNGRFRVRAAPDKLDNLVTVTSKGGNQIPANQPGTTRYEDTH